MPVTEYGWALPKRQQYLLELSSTPGSAQFQHKIDFQGQHRVFPVWRIPIGMPKYRLLNGRTSSLQQEWLAQNSSSPVDLFTRDPESDEAQKVQHGLLKQLIGDKNLAKFFEQHKQTEPIILDHFGFVVNGNRRLCAWRELVAKDPAGYAHFAHVDVAVLPKSDDKDIDRLEAQLQLEPDILADYKWHAFANMLLDRIRLHGYDEASLALLYNRRESEIREILDMRAYAAEYLRARGMEGRWSEVDDQYAFRAMVRVRKETRSAAEKRLFEVSAFALLDQPKGGRLYEYIPDLYKYRHQIKQRLQTEFSIQAPVDLTDDPLGADPEEFALQKIAEAVDDPNNRATAAGIIKDVIEIEDSLERERDSNRYVLKQLQKANAAVQAALNAIHRPDVVKDGITGTITGIDAGLAAIRNWLNANG